MDNTQPSRPGNECKKNGTCTSRLLTVLPSALAKATAEELDLNNRVNGSAGISLPARIIRVGVRTAYHTIDIHAKNMADASLIKCENVRYCLFPVP